MPIFLLLLAQVAALSREQEQRLLQEAVSQAGNSPVEFIHAAERHLRRYPHSALRDDIERAIARAAADVKDHARLLSYGEKVLARTDTDTTLLDSVARALLNSDAVPPARKALAYAQRLETIGDGPPTIARAQALQARALGNLGDIDKAIARALQSFKTYPTGEAAREAARWEARAGRLEDALRHYADAFTVPDPKVTPEDREHDRRAMGELYRRLHGSETGLGDLILQALDRTSPARPRPAPEPQDAFSFRLTGLRGDSLRLADLRGKVLVLDFWATWCAPCRFQHPLLEQVKRKYLQHQEVAFVSITTDQDRSLVRPFLDELKWPDQVYFDDGLARFYRITSIPTLLVFNQHGELVTRLPGFTHEGYAQLVTDRIEEARAE